MSPEPTSVLASATPEGTAQTDPIAVEGQALPEGDAVITPEVSSEPAIPEVAALPESYEFSLAEGVEVSESITNAAAEYATEHGLTQEQAQAHFDHSQATTAQYAQDMADMAATQSAEYLAEAKADPDIGGEHWDKTVSQVAKAMEVHGNDKVKEIFEKSGLGNHLEIIRTFASFGALANEDVHVNGRKAVAEKSRQATMYPNESKNT